MRPVIGFPRARGGWRPLNRMSHAIVGAIALGATALACTETSLPLEMTGVEWRLDSIVTPSGTIAAGLSPAPATLQFLFDVEHHDRGMVSGAGPCNRYSGEYRAFGDGGLTIGNVQRTLMACGDARDDLETAFLPRLSDVEAYALADGRLILSTVSRDRLHFRAP
jgi:heat shock protein HslJ